MWVVPKLRHMQRHGPLLLLALVRPGIATCGDDRIGSWDNVGVMATDAPHFLQKGINRLCDNAGNTAAGTLPNECDDLAGHLRDAGTCVEIGTLLVGVARVHSCYCQAAIAFADAAEAAGLRAAWPAAPSRSAAPGLALVGAAAFAVVVAGASTHLKSRRFSLL